MGARSRGSSPTPPTWALSLLAPLATTERCWWTLTQRSSWTFANGWVLVCLCICVRACCNTNVVVCEHEINFSLYINYIALLELLGWSFLLSFISDLFFFLSCWPFPFRKGGNREIKNQNGKFRENRQKNAEKSNGLKLITNRCTLKKLDVFPYRLYFSSYSGNEI